MCSHLQHLVNLIGPLVCSSVSAGENHTRGWERLSKVISVRFSKSLIIYFALAWDFYLFLVKFRSSFFVCLFTCIYGEVFGQTLPSDNQQTNQQSGLHSDSYSSPKSLWMKTRGIGKLHWICYEFTLTLHSFLMLLLTLLRMQTNCKVAVETAGSRRSLNYHSVFVRRLSTAVNS